MTAGFQTELRARAAEYASEWRPSVADEDEAAALLTEVKSRRRGRGLAAGASALGLAVVVGAAVMFGGGGPVAPATTPPGEGSDIAVLGTVGPTDVVLSLHGFGQNGLSNAGPEEVVIVHANAEGVERVSQEEIRRSLGASVRDWPIVSLGAVQPSLTRAVFVLVNPFAYVTPKVAIHNWVEGTTLVMDPCASTLSSIDVSRWCVDGSGPVVEDQTGLDFAQCVSAAARLGQVMASTCVDSEGLVYLRLTDMGSGKSSVMELGPGSLEPPLVLDDVVYANTATTEGGPVLVTSGGVPVQVGGAPVRGLAVVDGRLLVETNSDPWGTPSSYGRVLGLLSPGSGDFEELTQVPLGESTQVDVVPVLE